MNALMSFAQTSFEYSVEGDAEISPVFMLIYFAVVIAIVIAQWTVYTKADKPGWAAIVPIYNMIVLLEIVGRPIWWIVLFFVPFVNFIMAIIVMNDLAKSFGKGAGFTVLLIFLPFIAIPMLAWGDATYQGPAGEGGTTPPAEPAAA